jgi:hypothetical protein
VQFIYSMPGLSDLQIWPGTHKNSEVIAQDMAFR